MTSVVESNYEQLIESHLDLVDYVVRKVSGAFPAHIERQELIAAGRLGLTEAAMRFDPERGIPFTPFAAQRIRGAVLDVMRSQDWVPRRVRSTVREAGITETNLERRLGRPVEDVEVADAMGIDVQELRSSKAATAHGLVGSIDQSRPTDGASQESLADPTVMSVEELLEHRELHGYLRGALEHLPERLRLIVVGHFLEGRTLEDLAETLGLTASRVSQLKADAIDMLRDGINAQFAPPRTEKPKGRVEIRQAQFAAAIAQHADFRARLSWAEQSHGEQPPHIDQTA